MPWWARRTVRTGSLVENWASTRERSSRARVARARPHPRIQLVATARRAGGAARSAVFPRNTLGLRAAAVTGVTTGTLHTHGSSSCCVLRRARRRGVTQVRFIFVCEVQPVNSFTQSIVQHSFHFIYKQPEGQQRTRGAYGTGGGDTVGETAGRACEARRGASGRILGIVGAIIALVLPRGTVLARLT